jgi:hypothetical protein
MVIFYVKTNQYPEFQITWDPIKVSLTRAKVYYHVTFCQLIT